MLCNFQCVNVWNKMVEEKAGVVRREDSKKNEHACSVEGDFVVLDPSVPDCPSVFNVAGPTRNIQSSSKLREVRK